jgi:gamma-glutamylcyclotransferase
MILMGVSGGGGFSDRGSSIGANMVRSFAYGSSMDTNQTRKRCGNLKLKADCIAILRDHSLAFTRWSTIRQCGVADAVPNPGKEVWGVVFELNAAELKRLDESEGYDPNRARELNAYVREEREVYDQNNRPLKVQVYFVVKKGTYLPSSSYKKLILSGAREHHLPPAYVGELEKIQIDG